MKKKSILILILLTFWITYSIFSVSFYLIQANEFYEYHIDSRKKDINYQLDLATHFLIDGNAAGLVSRLQQARKNGYFDVFILRKGNEVLGYYNKDENLEGINFRYKASSELQEADDYLLKVINVGDYQLTLAIYKSNSQYLWLQLSSRKESIIVDLLMVTALVFLIVYLLLKDILQISKILQSKSRGDLTQIRTKSKEAEILLQAAEGYEATTKGLKKDNLLLASTLAPAVRMELRSGKKPPYNIACTVGRVDLNGYTQLVLEKNPNELLAILNEYFRRARDIIERYQGGMIYQYVGDEIVFIFKENDFYQDSTALQRATSAVRSLFEMADDLRSEGLPDGLKLKSSLVSGELRFVPLDQGYSFSGLPLIESVRMLGQVTEKTESSLVLYADALKQVRDLCDGQTTMTTVFKGFSNESHLIEVRKFKSLQYCLENCAPAMVADCFRSDSELVEVLNQMRISFERNEILTYFKFVGSLRTLVVDKVSEEVVSAYNRLFETAIYHKEFLKIESKFLASIVSLSQNLLQKDQVREGFRVNLDISSEALDPRVQANALVAKAHFDLDIVGFDKKMSSENNRIAADAVLVAGKVAFDEHLYERVVDFLESDKPRFQASALYIIAALIDYHYERDLVYLKANKHLKLLSKEVIKYVEHQDEIVKNRARLSQAIIEKVGVYAH